VSPFPLTLSVSLSWVFPSVLPHSSSTSQTFLKKVFFHQSCLSFQLSLVFLSVLFSLTLSFNLSCTFLPWQSFSLLFFLLYSSSLSPDFSVLLLMVLFLLLLHDLLSLVKSRLSFPSSLNLAFFFLLSLHPPHPLLPLSFSNSISSLSTLAYKLTRSFTPLSLFLYKLPPLFSNSKLKFWHSPSSTICFAPLLYPVSVSLTPVTIASPRLL